MNFKRFFTFISCVVILAGAIQAQSYYDDDIYYDASKAPKQTPKPKPASNGNAVVANYPSADSYAGVVNGTRTISVDDYNRRGIFANDSLSADSTATDFSYTRRIEQFYNPEVVSATGDEDLANIYYMEPDQVNIYVNTPSMYWGYDYFYPYTAWSYPYYWYNNPWRWHSSWYWGSWYDPYWAWGPSWSWGWGPAWGWTYPSWGWGRHYNPRHPGVAGSRPNHSGNPGVRPGSGSRPGVVNGGRHQGVGNGRYPGYNIGSRPGVNNNNGYNRPAGNNGSRPGVSNNGNNSRPSYNHNNNNSYNRPSTTNGGRYGGSYNSGGFGGGSRGSGYSGGGRSSSGGRGRH